ncbi:hypothetical protein G7007_06465 [Pseudomonas entomophila]|uniref:hypothetical protein n=1 Tax=Pseudomonas entomophila TaxID=312306 RepID=UPI0015E4066C|nr:hypothetical protein [Pseudomonas entomophila]MBA1192503.1 hypothetical protein [Pseudomonas entomophila]
MPELIQHLILVTFGFVLLWLLKPYPLRKWSGVGLLMAGLAGLFTAGQEHWLGFEQESLALLALSVGLALLLTRRRYAAVD